MRLDCEFMMGVEVKCLKRLFFDSGDFKYGLISGFQNHCSAGCLLDGRFLGQHKSVIGRWILLPEGFPKARKLRGKRARKFVGDLGSSSLFVFFKR